MISLQDVEKIKKINNTTVQSLHKINLNIEKGEIFGIIGRSSVEKSSLLRCINLLERPTTGNVYISEQNLTLLPEKMLRKIRKKIGILFPNHNLIPTRTVFENVALPLEIINSTNTEIEEITSKAVDEVGMTHRSMYYPNQLDQEQKQRTAIARALVSKPNVLLCDNPSQQLDNNGTQNIINLLKKVNKNYQTSIIITTNKAEILKQLCDRVGVLHQGALIEQTSIIDFFTNPQTEIAKEFIRSVAKQDLSTSLRRILNSNNIDNSVPLFRLSFLGRRAIEPIIAHLIQHFHLTINIIQAFQEQLQDESLGIMHLEIHGSADAIENGLAFLKEKSIFTEWLGYVSRNH